jgi:hypothetical protein
MSQPDTSRPANPFVKYAFWTFVLLYSSLLLYKPSFGLVDDHWVLTTLLADKPFPFFYSAADGRFAPLLGQEYNIVALFSASAFSFYFLNALELVFAGWLLVATAKLGMTKRNSPIPYIASFIVLLTPGFIEGWFRLFVAERNEFLFLSIFFYCFLKYQNNQRYLYYAMGITSAGLALFAKETTFVLVGGIGFVHVLLDKEHNYRKRLFDVSLVVVSTIWLAIYYFFIYRFRGPHVYGEQSGSKVLIYLRAFGSDTIHDPAVIVGILLLLSVRTFLLLTKKESKPVLDSVLIAGVCLVLAYLALHMGNSYYLLPLYLFVPYVVGVAASEERLRAIFKPWVLAALALLLLSQLTLGIRDLILLKVGPANFQAVLNAIDAQLSDTPGAVNIFVGGASRGSGIEIYSSLDEYLEFKGFKPGKFDLRSDLPIDDPLGFDRITSEIPRTPLSYLNPREDDHISKGDYVLLTPYDYSLNRHEELAHSSQYSLIFKTDSPAVPDLSVKRLLRTFIKKSRPYMHANDADPNYYLYKRITP